MRARDWYQFPMGALLKLLLLSIAISVSGFSWAQDVTYKAYVTNKIIDGQPTNEVVTEFSCSDRIYLIVEATGLKSEKYLLEVRWVNPVGEQQEITRYEFDGYPFTRVWAWLQLNGPTGAVIGQVFDPSFGMEDFIGEWNIKTSVGKDKLENIKFNVLC